MSIARRTVLASAALTLASFATALAPMPAAASGDTTPPAVPANLRVTQLSFTWLSFAWNASADNGGGQVTYEAKLTGTTWQSHTIQTSQSFGGLQAGVSYTASVRAFDSAGNASAAVSLVFTTLPRTQPPPNAPTNLRAVSAGGVVQSIAWDAPSAGLTYALYSGSGIIFWTSATSVTISHLVHNECAVEPGSTHTLTVQAWAPDNYPSSQSAPLTLTIPG